MYFKRPSFRRGGGIDQLTPRVHAQEGFLGNRDMFFLPSNLKNLQNQRFDVGTSGGVITSNAQKMRSYPMDATEMGVASIRSVEEFPLGSSAVGKGTKFKKQPAMEFNTTEKFIVVDRPTRTGGTTKVTIRNPNYKPPTFAELVEAGEGKFVTKKNRVGKEQKVYVPYTEEEKVGIATITESDDIKKAKSNRDFQQKVSEAEALLEDVEKKEREIIPGDDDSSITLDPMEEIKREKDFLSELLKNEGLERGEIALIAAKALGTEGSLKEKLDAAVNLALPVVRRRDREDKALTLTAYKAFKEKEKATAKAEADAAKDTTGIKDLKYQASVLMKTDKYKGKSRDEVIAEIVEKKFTDSDSEATKNYLRNNKVAGQIFEYFDEVKDAKRILDAYIKDKGDNLKADDRKLKLYKETLEQAKQNFNLFAKEPEFREVYGEMFRQFTALNLATGGRVNRALGSPNTGEQIITTEAETIGAETAEKPVLKLTFAELRNRLPQEITDDVVQLLANSEEALQDFAYIETQNDVDSFNLKYGVNLIIPPAPQTA
jgi:hypothetical protein